MTKQMQNLQQLNVMKMQSFKARALGLHSIKKKQRQQTVLWFPNCRAVHSFFLSTQHTLVFLDASLNVLNPYQIMSSNRCYWNREAAHAVELPAIFNHYPHDLLQSTLSVLLSRAYSM